MDIEKLIQILEEYKKNGVEQVFFQDYCWNSLEVEFQQMSEKTVCMVISEEVDEEDEEEEEVE